MPPSPLAEALQDPVTSPARLEIIRRLWSDQLPGAPREEGTDWNAYFSFYTKECNTGLLGSGQYLSARTHDDLLKIAKLLRTEASKEGVRSIIRQTLTEGRSLEAEDRMLDGTINLATRLLAMVNVGPLQNEISPQGTIDWNHGSLDKAVHVHFNAPPDPNFENVTLGSALTARSIDSNTDIEIIWTDNLTDHLRLIEEDKKLFIFHHASFLKQMDHIQSAMYPKEFVGETLDTLALLFPSTDRRTQRWLDRKSLTNLDGGLRNVGSFKANAPSRQLENFSFWRDRLSILKEVFDDALPPMASLANALTDRRQGDRWFNSWVALVAIGLTVFFGLVQSVEGAVQVYKAYHPAGN